MSAIPTPEMGAPRKRSSIAQSAAATTPANTTSAVPRDDRPSTGRPKRMREASVDMLLSLPEALKQRMVNTVGHTAPRTGVKHQQVFVRNAIEQLCERLEAEYNGGEPFPDIPEP